MNKMCTSDSKNAAPENVRLAAKVYDVHGSFITTVINCRVKDEHLRNDIYNEFFLALMQKPLPKNVENEKAYIYQAVCNEVNDALRKVESYKKHLSQHNLEARREVGLVYMSDSGKFDTIKEVSKLFELVESQLVASQAAVINFKHKKGLSNAEIAEKMNISVATVSTYYSSGLRRLREIVKKRKEEE